MKQKKQIVKKTQDRSNKPNTNLRIIPLGGQEEVGRNMTVFEYGHDIVILDMGIQFPEEDMPGIDYIIPNTTYLKGKEKNIRAVIFSHGHLDHIGAGPILLEKLKNPPIIGRPLTLALIKNRQEDYKKGTAKQLRTMTIKSINDKFTLGKFTISFFPVDHSIMDAVGVNLQTPQGTIIHPGDWTYEHDPIGRRQVTYHHLAKLPKPTFLMLESLGSTTKKMRVPEKVMHKNLDILIKQAPGRVIIGTFSSQIERIKRVVEYSQSIGKKVALDGYSMKKNVEVAKQLGYIKIKAGSLITIDQIHKYPDKKIVVICTGAQGEPNAVLSRIVNGSHRFVKIKKNDSIIFSSSVIPGNERTIQRLKDNLYRLSDNVIHSEVMDIHSSGHSTADDIVEVVKQIKPTYFLPVYANHYFLKEAKKLVIKNNFPEKNIFILDNGSVLEINRNHAQILNKKVPTDYVFVDGLGIGDVSNIVLRDRQMLADDGMFVVIVTIDSKTGNLIGSPDIISRGFIYMKENKQLLSQVRDKLKKILKDKEPRAKADEFYIKNKIRDQIGQFLFTKTERRPMVLPVVIEV
ncbi:ribonuclease J [Patescibacteria group bacterium]|nr:ribonuclease J [Patescibacteria group bacterium]